MRSLNLALFAEGPTDHRFLQPLLRRVALDLCHARSRGEVEVGEVLELHTPPHLVGQGRAVYVPAVAREAAGGFHVLCIHTDGNSDPAAARRERCEPAMQILEGEFHESGHRCVAAVPVREMEAWALVDGDALRNAFGTTLSDQDLGLPSPRDVERIQDPKAALQGILDRVAGRRRRSRASNFLDVLGQTAALDRLRLVPSFLRFEQELEGALFDLGFLG